MTDADRLMRELEALRAWAQELAMWVVGCKEIGGVGWFPETGARAYLASLEQLEAAVAKPAIDRREAPMTAEPIEPEAELMGCRWAVYLLEDGSYEPAPYRGTGKLIALAYSEGWARIWAATMNDCSTLGLLGERPETASRGRVVAHGR